MSSEAWYINLMIQFLFIKGVIEVGYNVNTFFQTKEQKELQTQGCCEKIIKDKIDSSSVETEACKLDYVLAYTHFLNVNYDEKLNPILGCADTHKLTQPFSVYKEKQFEPVNSTLSSSEHIMMNKNKNKYLHRLKNGYI